LVNILLIFFLLIRDNHKFWCYIPYIRRYHYHKLVESKEDKNLKKTVSKAYYQTFSLVSILTLEVLYLCSLFILQMAKDLSIKWQTFTFINSLEKQLNS
jgi:hypothetical protein